jgi:hypothetical protein
MTAAVVLSSSLLAVLLVAVLVREIRRRRATQVLASRILERWRNRNAEELVVPRPLDNAADDDARLRRRA